MSGELSYLWHYWINSLSPDGPAGDPHKKRLYSFKSALESLGYFERYLREAFTGTLPTKHQQCSHTLPEPIKDNRVVCGLGKCVTECPILVSLKEKFDKDRERAYYAERVRPEQVYELMAKTCAWHMLSEEERGIYIDWNEGAMQDVSDRMFWNRVYDNLSQSHEENDEEPTP